MSVCIYMLMKTRRQHSTSDLPCMHLKLVPVLEDHLKTLGSAGPTIQEIILVIIHNFMNARKLYIHKLNLTNHQPI